MTKRNKLKRIQAIIDKYIKVLEGLPAGAVLDDTTAKKLGIPKRLRPLLESAYKYGRHEGKTKAKVSKDLVEKYFEKLTPKGKDFLDIKTVEAEQDLSYLLEKVRTRLTKASVDTLKREFKVLETVFKDEPIPKRWLAGELRKVTGDLRQDWDMVVRTELVNTEQQGIAHAILEGKSPYSDKGADTMVFKRPNPDACPHCKKHYLEKDGTTPRLFKLSELIANGDNYGKKTADWKPTLGVMHPHCSCILNVMPEGCVFDENGRIIVEDKGGDK